MKPRFFNLLSNALKYSKKNIAPVIKITAEDFLNDEINGLVKSPEKYCRIYITDNGIGFEQQYAEQIFEMFQRLHSQAEYKGNGIGLTLCQQIVEKHHGYISALSKVNEGTTFIVSLPKEQKVEISN